MIKCNFCSDPAKFDGKTTLGPWGFMCEDHFKSEGYPDNPGLFTVLPQARERSSNRQELSFSQWMDKVAGVMVDLAGVYPLDIDDYSYQDAYDDGDSPQGVAIDALENAGFMIG